MTPARLDMVRERLREFAPELDEAAIARMMRAEAMEEALLQVLLLGDGCLLVRCRGAECCRDGNIRALLGIDMEGYGPVLDRLDVLPSRTKQSGAYAPRPETELRGGLTVRAGAPVCSHCRDEERRLDCRACGGTGLANLEDVRSDVPWCDTCGDELCVCDRFPGAGAG